MIRLKELRLNKGVSRIQVASAIGYSINAYIHYENETREPDISTLKLLSKYFGVSIDHIVCND
ncbi:MAG: helix-turn-helix transcriptional regulator [Clostridia bacterium]|jgi:transcriptional regulator with XRE-family HTH domain|nr:helix-turn-helix transcriptional regulator [Clostridia bacterium]